MKVYNTLEELLEDFSLKFDLTRFMSKQRLNEIIIDYTSSNSLALGKPEPLAKNKQTENNFICYLYESKRCSAKCTKPCGDIDCIAV